MSDEKTCNHAKLLDQIVKVQSALEAAKYEIQQLVANTNTLENAKQHLESRVVILESRLQCQ